MLGYSGGPEWFVIFMMPDGYVFNGLYSKVIRADLRFSTVLSDARTLVTIEGAKSKTSKWITLLHFHVNTTIDGKRCKNMRTLCIIVRALAVETYCKTCQNPINVAKILQNIDNTFLLTSKY